MRGAARGNIGTKHESSLHRTLKFHYACGGETEIERAGYVCDAVGPGGEAVEIQIGSFGPLRNKIPSLAAEGPVRLIYPVIVQKTIELYDTGGNLISRRKSPRRGGPWDIFKALLYAPELAILPGLTIEIAFIDAVESRIADGLGSWRRKGISIADRRIEAWRETLVLAAPADYRRFIPFQDGEEFTSKVLAEKARIRRTLAGKTLYVLQKNGLVKRLRKSGHSWVYAPGRKTPQNPGPPGE
ncbi:MAG: hypothetical protein LBQ44_08790 [Treponema sp.]|jgi:hypothetical protein|nr:hypothetical protein [Treponema sp.]